MELKPYDYRDPGEIVRAVADRERLTREAAFLVLVEDPSTTQRVVSITRLEAPARLSDYEPARDELHDLLEQAPIPISGRRDGGPRHSATVVVARRGLCVLGPNEALWFNAWRYVNTLAAVYTSNLILVTEHGWHDFATRWGGSTPALRPAGRGQARGRLRTV